jgi:Zn-dependent protease with chaperone function
MESIQKVSQELSTASEQLGKIAQVQLKPDIWKKIRGGFLFVLGYLLSPLCWWNDLLFNLPIAYFFGYLCSLLSPKLLVPCSIIGYWLSNIIGILLMQMGSADVFQKEPKERNLKKELLTGLVSSTVFTLVIILLIQLNILDTPDLFTNG